MQIFNTMTRKKEDFIPQEPGVYRIYVCGPTVYNYIHIGNARPMIVFDTLRRYLEYLGNKVLYVSNITDIDDKLIKKGQENGTTMQEVARKFEAEYIKDSEGLNVKTPTVRPRATEHIGEIIKIVKDLVESGHAYVAHNGDVYFRVKSDPGYGKLSHLNLDDLESGNRELRSQMDDDLKEDPADFAVWKAAKPGEPSWKSPWGMGRPGWHIECSAMSRKYLGLPLDIHGGGADLVFPHHENETAQSEAAWGTKFANYWLHSGMLQINAEKMSKSLGNFLLLRDVLKTTKPAVLRMLMMQTHYRSPLDFSQDRLEEAAAALERIQSLVARIDWAMENAQDIPSPLDTRTIVNRTRETRNEFIFAMDDDFNTAGGLGVIFTFVGELNTALGDKTVSISDVPVLRGARDVICELMNVFGIDLSQEATAEGDYPVEVVDLAAKVAGYAGADAHEAVDALLEARTKARAEKNFAVADAVRDGLTGLGFTVEDTPQGPRVTFGD